MESKTRIGGARFTTMTFRGTRLAYLQTLQDTQPQPVAGAQVVQAIDDEVPQEIVTSMAVGAGTMRMTFFELWNEPVWSRLPGLEGTNTLLDVLKRQIQLGEIACRKLIKSPSGITSARVYHGCVLTDIDEGEQINIGTMTIPKTITMQYIKTTIV